jgi:hypothetical protein
VSAPTRECRGCDGRAWSLPYDTEHIGWSACPDCPICLGSGQVEAKPSVRDAEADAETLRGMTHTKPATNMTRQGIARAGLGIAFETVHDGPALVQNAARAAFRAVPGLRGE